MPSHDNVTAENEFEQIIKTTDEMLWAAYRASTAPTDAQERETTKRVQIRFPRRRDGEIRVSEQEARFILTGELAKSNLLYSVETPTSLTYQLTGNFGLSGQTDVTVLKPCGECLWKIEFKADGFTVDRQDKLPIQKDLEKLLREPSPAYWFHTFKGVTNLTLTSTWNAFIADIRKVINLIQDEKMLAKSFVFHACVLRERFSVEHRLTLDPAGWKKGNGLNLTGPTYQISKSNLAEHQEENGWKFHLPQVAQ
jgi:hypothetical protein